MDASEHDKAKAVKDAVSDQLFKIPDVHAVAVQQKEIGGLPTEQWAIAVYVPKKKPQADLEPSERIPETISGIPTDVVEAPPFDSLVKYSEDLEEDPDLSYRPLQGGAQIGVKVVVDGQQKWAIGTLGGFGRYKTSLVGLPLAVAVSNYHVMHNQFVVDPSKIPVYQPSNSSPAISLYSGGALDPRGDMAMALIEPDNSDFKNEVLNIGEITGSYTVVPGDLPNFAVTKSGVGSNVTNGTVTSLTADVTIEGVAFKNQMFIRKVGDVFSVRGDSGSFVLDSQNRVVGLLFASNPLGDGLATPVALVESILQIDIPAPPLPE